MTRRPARAPMLGTVALLVAGCGLPSDGGHPVDDATVPYHLLDDSPAPGNSDGKSPSSADPLVFWVNGQGRLIPRRTSESCPVKLGDLLDDLSGGPSQELREHGLSTALPPESHLKLVSRAADMVAVDVETQAPVSADRLPVAIAQIVLTMTSAPGVSRVSLLSNGDPVQIPLADGALSTRPVTASSYVSLVPTWYRGSAPFRQHRTSDELCPTGR